MLRNRVKKFASCVLASLSRHDIVVLRSRGGLPKSLSVDSSFETSKFFHFIRRKNK